MRRSRIALALATATALTGAILTAMPVANADPIGDARAQAAALAHSIEQLQTRAEVATERKTYVAAGTLFGKQFLRLVRLGSYHLDAHMDGPMLVFTHHDRPGLIGFIGKTFGGILNWAGMT